MAGPMHTVKGAALDERFDRCFVHDALWHALAKLKERSEWTVFCSLDDDRIDCFGRNTFDRAHAEAHMPGAGCPLFAFFVDRSKIARREIDVRRADLDADTTVGPAHTFAVFKIRRPVSDLLRLAFVRQQRRHVMAGEVCLQECGLVGDDRIAGRMAFVEPVAGELEDQIEELFRFFLRKPFYLCISDEPHAVGVNDLFLFLTDRLDKRVRIAQPNTAQLVDDLHDLFLVDHHAVRLSGVPIDDGVNLGHALLAVLSAVVVGDQIHRPRAEERVCCDEVFEPIRLHFSEQSTHAA